MRQKLQSIMDELGADTGTIHLLVDGVLVLKAHAGVPDPVLDAVRVVPVGKGMAGLAQQRNEPVSSCNLQRDPSPNIPTGAKTTGVHGALVVPVRDSEGRSIGAVGIGVHQDYQYTETETARLLELATQLLPENPSPDSSPSL